MKFLNTFLNVQTRYLNILNMGHYFSPAGSTSFALSRTFIFLILLCYSMCSTIAGNQNQKKHDSRYNLPQPFRSQEFISANYDVTYGYEIPRPSSSPSLSQQRFCFLFTSSYRSKINHYHSKLTSVNPRHRNAWLGIILLLSGDLHQNPGPTNSKSTCKSPTPAQHLCDVCNLDCKRMSIQCDDCDVW